jgi:hypothetical protein
VLTAAYVVVLAVALLTVDSWGPAVTGWVAPDPAEVTCEDWRGSPHRRETTVRKVAAEFDDVGLGRSALEVVIRSEVKAACVGREQDYKPVTSDLRGSIARELEESDRRRR